MSNNGLSIFLLVGLMLGVIFLLQWVWRRPLPKESILPETSDSRESRVTPRPLMTPDEATLFNLIRLAAQEYFLVLVKLPIFQVVSIEDTDEEARKALMRAIQPVRLDVVLVHPGTLQAVTVVHFKKAEQEGRQLDKRDQVVETVLKAAGLNVVILRLDQSYSVDHVTAKLGLNEDE